MKKYNYIIISLIIVILITVSVLVYTYFFEEKIIFTLFGDKEITLYEGATYNEIGYVAVTENGDNLTDSVKVNSNLNTNKVGKYKIKYEIRSLFKLYKDERIINVVEDSLKEVDFSLNGSSIANLQMGRVYNDPKFKCVHRVTGEDLTKYVVIENNINNKKEGSYLINYYLRYNGKEKVLTRKIYVFEQTNSHSLSTTSLTNKPVSVKFQSYIYNFSHVVCPNDTIIYKNSFNYNFYENGKYSFYIYDTMDNYEEYVITINNIDMIAPTGTCSASLINGKTSYSVKTKDDDIKEFLYGNDKNYSSTKNNLIVDTYQRNGIVVLVDKAGNKTAVKCDMKRKYNKPINPPVSDNVKYSSVSDSLIVNVGYKDGYYITRIWAKDPYLQLRKEMLSDNSRSLKLPKKILEQAISKYKLENKIIFGGNASAPVLKGTHYSYVAEKSSIYNLKEPSSLLVYNGKVIINDYSKYAGNAVIYYIDGGNRLSYIPVMEKESAATRKKVFEEALKKGIYNTFAFNAILVENGVSQKVGSDYYALRNGFCQIDENNFISIVSDTKKWHKQDFANFMQKLGCKTAVNFDGGGSVALFYKAKNSRDLKTLTGNTRTLSSVMYFTEL